MKTNYFILIQLLFLSAVSAQQISNEVIEEVENNENLISFVNSFPNPSDDFVRINVDANFNRVVLKAKTHELYTLEADNNIIDISELPKGIYTVRIDTIDRIYFSKLFKK